MNDKMSEANLLNATKGESDSPFKINKEVVCNDDMAHNSLQYLKENNSDDYEVHKKKFVLMVEELFPLSVNQIVEWGEVSLREQKEMFQSCSLIINEYAELNAVERLTHFKNKKKPVKKSFIRNIFSVFKSSEEMDDRSEIDSLKNSLSILLPQIDQLNERLENNYVRFRLMVIRAIVESNDIQNISIYEALDNRRQLFFYALQNIEVSRTQLKDARDTILKQLINIDHIITVTLPLLYRVDDSK